MFAIFFQAISIIEYVICWDSIQKFEYFENQLT